MTFGALSRSDTTVSDDHSVLPTPYVAATRLMTPMVSASTHTTKSP